MVRRGGRKEAGPSSATCNVQGEQATCVLLVPGAATMATIAARRHGGANHRELATGLHIRKMDLHGSARKDIHRGLLNIPWFFARHLHSMVAEWDSFTLDTFSSQCTSDGHIVSSLLLVSG
jgi:hypothetical protein